jgi:hypothetical protein
MNIELTTEEKIDFINKMINSLVYQINDVKNSISLNDEDRFETNAMQEKLNILTDKKAFLDNYVDLLTKNQ